MNACPGREELELLLAKRIDDTVRDRLELHVEACDSCQQLLELLTASTSLGHSSGRGDDDTQTAAFIRDATAPAAPAVASSGHRFRVLRHHARGGLGTVFVALDGELNREVALKQILDSHADDASSRQRFLLEAEITGGLEHPGIVPVYGLGTYEGRPYYAMRFIRGDSLRVAIDQFHSDRELQSDLGRRSLALMKLLRRFIDVCQAIEYAHLRGVLHRDVKPSNIIVGKHGETLVVDWGLAKPVVRAEPGSDTEESRFMPSTASGTAETLPGSALGTPSYMSPEQASGDLERLGPRSDIYSLGATLYCLLVGRPPVEGDDVGELLRRAQEGDYPKPRQIDPALDRALEAVCKKAMAKNPIDRYPSSRALAEDIERWMADEPVGAYREPVSRRARRWAKRNRLPVAMLGVALVAGVVGLAAVLAVQTQAKASIARALYRETQANVALAEANLELSRSKEAVQERYNLAVEAIRTFHTGVSEDFLFKQHEFKELRDRLLKSASDFYVKLNRLLGRETDVASRRSLAASNFELARVTAAVGRSDDSLAAYRAVLAARESLAAEQSLDIALQVEVGQSLTAVASMLERTGKPDEAIATYRRSESLLAALAGREPTARTALAFCRMRLGWLLTQLSRSAEALLALQLARTEQEILAAEPGAPVEARRELADTVGTIGNLLMTTGKPPAAEAEYRAAVAIYQTLVDDHPGVTQFRDRLATSHGNLGLLLSQTTQRAAAEHEYRATLAMWQKLVDASPSVKRFREKLAFTHNGLGYLFSQTGKPSEAVTEYRAVLAIQQKLADDNPAVNDFRGMAAHSQLNLGVRLAKMGKRSEADAAYRAALATHRALAEAEPADPKWRMYVGVGFMNLGELEMDAGRLAGAVALFREGATVLERLTREYPPIAQYRVYLAYNLDRLGRALVRAAQPAEAVEPLRRAVAVWEAMPTLNPDDGFELARAYAVLASIVADPGSRLTSRSASVDADRAMAALRRAVAGGYRDIATLRDDPDLAPLRDREEFRALLLDLAMPDDVLAPAR